MSNMRKPNNQAGFTLIEMAIVTIISGIMMLGVVSTYDGYAKDIKVKQTKERMQKVNNLVRLFKDVKGAYPCPADPRLGPGHEEFGVANCLAAGVRRTPGQRDADGDGVNEFVFIGAVPLTTIRSAPDPDPNVGGIGAMAGGISNDVMVDGWQSKMTYAVSEALTSRDTFNIDAGVIAGEDEHGNAVAGIDDDAHYVVVSHGKDQSGAYSMDGSLIERCTRTITNGLQDVEGGEFGGEQLGVDVAQAPGDDDPPPPDDDDDGPVVVENTGQRGDRENCDGDSTFVQSLTLYKGDGDIEVDDYALFQKVAYSSLWTNVPEVDVDGDLTGNLTGHIMNLNTGNVGIATDLPPDMEQEKLTVGCYDNDDDGSELCDSGPLVSEGVLKADKNTRAKQICLRDGSKCFNIESITGNVDEMDCPPGQVMTGVMLDEDTGALSASCLTVIMTAVQDGQTCPDGEFISSIRTDGIIRCVGPDIR